MQRDLTEEQNERLRLLVQTFIGKGKRSQTELAHEIGVPPSSISRFLGRKQGMSISAAIRTCAYFRLDAVETLDLDLDPPANIESLPEPLRLVMESEEGRGWLRETHLALAARASAPAPALSQTLWLRLGRAYELAHQAARDSARVEGFMSDGVQTVLTKEGEEVLRRSVKALSEKGRRTPP